MSTLHTVKQEATIISLKCILLAFLLVKIIKSLCTSLCKSGYRHHKHFTERASDDRTIMSGYRVIQFCPWLCICGFSSLGSFNLTIVFKNFLKLLGTLPNANIETDTFVFGEGQSCWCSQISGTCVLYMYAISITPYGIRLHSVTEFACKRCEWLPYPASSNGVHMVFTKSISLRHYLVTIQMRDTTPPKQKASCG